MQIEKEAKVGDSIQGFKGATVRIPIEPNFVGGYRLEYDGKYITLHGKDSRYEVNAYFKPNPPEYEEMVLVPVVLEVRNANPQIKEVTDNEIIVDLGFL